MRVGAGVGLVVIEGEGGIGGGGKKEGTVLGDLCSNFSQNKTLSWSQLVLLRKGASLTETTISATKTQSCINSVCK